MGELEEQRRNLRVIERHDMPVAIWKNILSNHEPHRFAFRSQDKVADLYGLNVDYLERAALA